MPIQFSKFQTGSDVTVQLPSFIISLYLSVLAFALPLIHSSNYDDSCKLTSLPVSELERFRRFIFVAMSVHTLTADKYKVWGFAWQSRLKVVTPLKVKYVPARSYGITTHKARTKI
jgi:hypothetical protein